MMAEIVNPEEAADSAFEIVQPSIRGGTAGHLAAEHPSVPSSFADQISHSTAAPPPAPSALPAFAQMPPHNTHNFSNQQQPAEPSPLAISAPSSALAQPASRVTNPFSVRASAGQSLSSVVHASPHVPQTMGGVSSAPFFSSPPLEPGRPQPPTAYGMPLAQTGLDMPFEVSSVSQQPNDPTGPLSSGFAKDSGMWNWVNKTISQSDFLSKIAEKAKTSVDNVITTLDPQMKHYMNPAGAVEFFAISADADALSAIKTGLSRYVPNLIVRGVPPAHAPNVAQQPVGFDNGITAANEYIRAVRNSNLVSPNSLVVGCNSFIVECSDQNWYEFLCVAMNDGANVDLRAFSQPTPVPAFAIDALKRQTPADYPLASSGFACGVEQVLAQSRGLANWDWRLQYAGVSKLELVVAASASLAYLYKSSFM